MKIAYAGESQMIVEDALNRMDEVLEAAELQEADEETAVKDASIRLDNVTFTYGDSKITR